MIFFNLKENKKFNHFLQNIKSLENSNFYHIILKDNNKLNHRLTH